MGIQFKSLLGHQPEPRVSGSKTDPIALFLLEKWGYSHGFWEGEMISTIKLGHCPAP